MNKIMNNYIKTLAKNNERMDGRKLDEFRKEIKIEYGVSAKSAAGSAKVTIGDTVVVAGIKLTIGSPFTDTPEEGALMVNVELSPPLASPDFESGPPDSYSIELARLTDRAVRESGMIDVKKLCIKEGETIWMVNIDIYPINDGGNLFDACGLVAIAAILDTRLPTLKQVEEKYEADYDNMTEERLPINEIPINLTIGKLGEHLVVDPTYEEEKAFDARLTVCITEDGQICSLQKGKDAPLTIEDLDAIISLAKSKAGKLRELFGGRQ